MPLLRLLISSNSNPALAGAVALGLLLPSVYMLQAQKIEKERPGKAKAKAKASKRKNTMEDSFQTYWGQTLQITPTPLVTTPAAATVRPVSTTTAEFSMSRCFVNDRLNSRTPEAL